MAHVLATEVNEEIIAAPGKETGVWNALSALYFEDKIPVNNITYDLILDKRRELEGKAGDKSNLKKMIARWCRRYKINPYDDPNINQTRLNKSNVDPIQQITAGLYNSINETVRAEVQTEINELKEKLELANTENLELKEKVGRLSANFTKTTNEYNLALDKLATNTRSGTFL